MQQEFLFLADSAEATNGKIYVLGGGADRHFVQPGWTAPINLRADIAVGILVTWAEANRRHTFAVRVLDEDDREVVAANGEFESHTSIGAKLGQDLRSVLTLKGPFPLPGLGGYKLVLELGGVRQSPPFRFWVDELQPPTGGTN